MREIRWNPLKSARLKRVRGMSFEEIVDFPLIQARAHPARQEQRLLLFNVRGYVWAVPFAIDAHGLFLKTLYPSRKHTRLYREGKL